MARNPNRMQEATERLMSCFQGSAAVLITYSRGASAIPSLTATVGRTPYEVMQGDVMIAYESRDYLIQKSDLSLGGDQWMPMRGDRITESDGRVYEVSAPKPFNVYESIGPDGTVYKVHTVGPKSP